MLRAKGRLNYSMDHVGYRLVITLSRDFGAYYRSLIPKSLPVQAPKYPPHVTVIRSGRDVPTNLEAWGKYQGDIIEFQYPSYVHVGRDYYWLEVWCDRLEEIRVELGLQPVSQWTRPPGGRARCFHTTIGNRKHVGPAAVRFNCCEGRH
jgi:hypothetical protein